MKLCKSISSSESTSFLSIFYFQIIAYKPQKTSEPIKLIGSTLLLKNTPFARDWANSVIFQDVCAFSLNNTFYFLSQKNKWTVMTPKALLQIAKLIIVYYYIILYI